MEKEHENGIAKNGRGNGGLWLIEYPFAINLLLSKGDSTKEDTMSTKRFDCNLWRKMLFPP